jgi:hypothetical protein
MAQVQVVQAPSVQAVVLDEWPQDQAGISHGTLVESVLEQRIGTDAQRMEVRLGPGTSAIERGLKDSLNNYVVARFVVPTQATAEALDQLSGATIASQSQGASESRVVQNLWNLANSNGAARTHMATQLGLSPQSGDRELLQALVTRVDSLHSTHPQIQEARQDLLESAQQASERGVIRVLSAGNNGQLEQTLQQYGITPSADFFRSDLADPAAIIVGAADAGQRAPIASPDAGAVVGAQGMNVTIQVNGQPQQHTGSSYAQPQVAGLVYEWKLADSELTAKDLQGRLCREAQPVAEQQAYVGCGVIPFPSH